jgi:hypothetical protein
MLNIGKVLMGEGYWREESGNVEGGQVVMSSHTGLRGGVRCDKGKYKLRGV